MTIMCCVWDIHCNWFKISDWDQKIRPFHLNGAQNMTITCLVWNMNCNWIVTGLTSGTKIIVNTTFVLTWSEEHDYHVFCLRQECVKVCSGQNF